MRYSELELKRLFNKGHENLSTEEEIAANILNFISCIHLNKQDFYSEPFNSQYFGELEMDFQKPGNCLIGSCRVHIKIQDKILFYLFTENGFEELKDVVV
ncbi:MAG: hypothetical protein PHE79_01870 [Eubacteriales bacterium]|nr:hypothetical protein [Eubacteriales bacterium]